MKKVFQLIFSIAVASLLMIGCDSDDNSQGTSGISVRLVDAPGDYESVFIDVEGVEVIVDDEKMMLDTNEGIYDLLTLTGGEFVDIVNEDIPSGNISQIRLLLGIDNTVVLSGGEEVSLQTPSAQQSGLKLNVNYDLEPGIQYEFILDFNVDESIVAQGNSGQLLKPVIRVTTTAESGAISGSVQPFDVQTNVTATNDANDEEISAYVNDSGEFLLYGVPAGTYTVVIESETGATTTINDVNVEVGENESLGLIML